MLKDRKKLMFLVKALPIFAVILVSASLIVISVIGINSYFNDEMKKEEKEIQYKTIYEAKKHLKASKALIHNISLITLSSYKREIKMAVNVGYNLLDLINSQYRGYPKDIVLQHVKDYLRNIRFYDDKSGYFFIYDMKANLLLLPIKPSLEGKNFWDYKDINGKYVLRDIINELKKTPEGIFDNWYYYKPNTTKILHKIGFIKYYKPLDILIGSAVYEDIIQKEIYKRVAQTISKINTALAKEKDLTIVTNKGFVIYAKDMKYFHTNQYEKFKNIIDLAKKSEGIVELRDKDKLFMISYYKPLNFVIFQTIHLSKLHNLIENKKENINNVVSYVIKQFLVIAFILILVILLLTNYLLKKIEKIFNRYDEAINKEKEKAQNAAKVKSEFLANMSHEIRTPLNAMFGFIKILKEKEKDEENKKYLNIIEKSGENLLTIINDILDLSKLEAKKFYIEHIEFNPKEEVEVIYSLFVSKASEKDILLKMNIDNLKYNIVTDPTRLKQVIANLLSNAIKFTPENKTITLNINYDDKNEKLFVEVIDEGIGIEKDRIKHIFEAFSQADTSTTRKYGGTGLGLTISYKLVELLGGELKVESEVGKGSRFYFSIPAKKGELSKEINKKKKDIVDEKFDYKILLVEDNIANQMFMKVILKQMGISFDIANDGIEAIEKFKNNKYDFILMDENMPNMNGIEATKKIRKIEKENNLGHTIIIALTANALEGDKERFLKAGMDFYLSKPLNIEKLKEILRNLKKEKKLGKI